MKNLKDRVAGLESVAGQAERRGMTVVAWDGRALADVLHEFGVVERVGDTIARVCKPGPCPSSLHFWGY